MKHKILVIDDDNAFSFLVRRALEAEVTSEVFTAESGETGIDLCHRVEPDIVFLDMRLQDMTGDEIARKIKSYCRKLPKIIGLTGHSPEDCSIDPEETGIQFCLQKPFHFEELTNLLKTSIQSVIA